MIILFYAFSRNYFASVYFFVVSQYCTRRSPLSVNFLYFSFLQSKICYVFNFQLSRQGFLHEKLRLVFYKFSFPKLLFTLFYCLEFFFNRIIIWLNNKLLGLWCCHKSLSRGRNNSLFWFFFSNITMHCIKNVLLKPRFQFIKRMILENLLCS